MLGLLRILLPKRSLINLCACLMLAWGGMAVSQPVTQGPSVIAPSGVVSLSAVATVEISKDMLTMVFSTTKEGAEANAVQTALKQALDAALSEAKKVSKPGLIDIQTGTFALAPRYTNKGVINGWQGTAELLVSGKDMAGIAQLAGRLGSMVVSHVHYDLSREVRERVEGDITAQAIARFRAKAADMTKHFGYSSYAIREVNVTTNEPATGGGMVMRERLSRAKVADDSMPIEPGKGQVTAMVNGTVQMQR